MKRTVKVRSCIGHHFDFADLKLRARRIVFFGLFAAENVTDNRRRQTLVRDQALLNGVTEIDRLFRGHLTGIIARQSRIAGYEVIYEAAFEVKRF